MSKRIFDLFVVLLTAPFWLPMLAAIAVLVRWKLGNPVLFRQKRPGLHGRPFEIIKFRSMRDLRDAEGRLLPDLERMTSCGRWLRASSLDELPELINVLKGEMSLVGPRPLLLQYLERFTPRQLRRHDVLPGLTGLAQVNGRNAITWEEKFELDLEYVNRRSLLLDLRILLTTIAVVFGRRGINKNGAATMPEFFPTHQDPES